MLHPMLMQPRLTATWRLLGNGKLTVTVMLVAPFNTLAGMTELWP